MEVEALWVSTILERCFKNKNDFIIWRGLTFLFALAWYQIVGLPVVQYRSINQSETRVQVEAVVLDQLAHTHPPDHLVNNCLASVCCLLFISSETSGNLTFWQKCHFSKSRWFFSASPMCAWELREELLGGIRSCHYMSFARLFDVHAWIRLELIDRPEQWTLPSKN